MGRDGGTDMPVNPSRVEMSAADLNAFGEKLAEANQTRFGSLLSDDAPELKPPDWEVEISSYRQVGGDHYERMAIQPWDALAAWLSPSEFRAHLRASAIEYLARSESKGGMADVRKAHHCLAKALESYAQEGE